MSNMTGRVWRLKLNEAQRHLGNAEFDVHGHVGLECMKRRMSAWMGSVRRLFFLGVDVVPIAQNKIVGSTNPRTPHSLSQSQPVARVTPLQLAAEVHARETPEPRCDPMQTHYIRFAAD